MERTWLPVCLIILHLLNWCPIEIRLCNHLDYFPLLSGGGVFPYSTQGARPLILLLHQGRVPLTLTHSHSHKWSLFEEQKRNVLSTTLYWQKFGNHNILVVIVWYIKYFDLDCLFLGFHIETKLIDLQG